MTGMTSATQNDCKAPALELPGVSVQPQADKAQITEHLLHKSDDSSLIPDTTVCMCVCVCVRTKNRPGGIAP